jgi:hypothetical protein
VTFFEAQLRLLAEISSLVQNGHVTERGMARLTGVSQPHMHNVLKGVRTLSPKITDRLLGLLHMSVLDLSSVDELRNRLMIAQTRTLAMELKVLHEPIGPNTMWKNNHFSKEVPLILPVPTHFCERAHLAAVRLRPDFRMTDVLEESDLAVVSTAAPALPLDPRGLYVVQIAGGTAVRYLRKGTSHLYISTADTLESPSEWERAPLSDWSSIVCGQLLWIGKEKDLRLPIYPRGRVLATTS